MKKFILLFCVFLGNTLLNSAHAGTVSVNNLNYRIVSALSALAEGAHPFLRCPGPNDAEGCWGSGLVLLDLSHRQQNIRVYIQTNTIHGFNAAEVEQRILNDIESLLNTLKSIKTSTIERQVINGREHCFRTNEMIIQTAGDDSLVLLDRDVTILRRRVSCR